MPRLGVNIDHVATLRQARKTSYPDPVQAALEAEAAGADQITIHLREDRRHIQDRDVLKIREGIGVRLNLEMAATEEMVQIALQSRPDIVTLVPEKRQELTTEGGLQLQENLNRLKEVVEALQGSKIPVSLFVNPSLEDVQRSQDLRVYAVELHTGQYAEASSPQRIQEEFRRIKDAARLAADLKLKVFAGHGLHYENIPPLFLIQEIEEYNIGHSIIARAIFIGLSAAVKEMKALLQSSNTLPVTF